MHRSENPFVQSSQHTRSTTFSRQQAWTIALGLGRYINHKLFISMRMPRRKSVACQWVTTVGHLRSVQLVNPSIMNQTRQVDSVNRSKYRNSLQRLIAMVLLFVSIVAFGCFVSSLPRQREASRIREAFKFLHEIRDAQQSYFAVHGFYAQNVIDLDLSRPSPAYFDLAPIRVVSEDNSLNLQCATSWQMSLVRGCLSNWFGQYRITFNQDGFDPQQSTLHQSLLPSLLPEESPLSTYALAVLNR